MRQFIESMFYLDVVRCRKCRGGVGEFYTAPALFLHCASIYFLHKIATRKSGSLFYFFDFRKVSPFLFRKIFLLYYGENCYYNNVWKSVIQFTFGKTAIAIRYLQVKYLQEVTPYLSRDRLEEPTW